MQKKSKLSSKGQTVTYHNRFLAGENDENGVDTMRAIPLRYVKKGDYFKLKPTDTAPVWIKDDYDKTDKKFWAYKYVGTTFKQFSGSVIVYVDFWF